VNIISTLKKSSVALGAVASMAMGFSTAADAALITGRFNATFGTVIAGTGEVDWAPPADPGPAPIGSPTYGSFEVNPVVASRSGSFLDPVFSALPSPGLVQDLSNNIADGNYVPVGAFAPIANFLQLSEKPNWQFNATHLEAGSLPGTPFVIAQNGANVSVTLSVNGFACDTGANTICNQMDAATTSVWTMIFSTQYTNTNVADVIAALGAGSLPENTWSGTFEAFAMPEPGSLALVGLAFAGLAGAGRLRRKQA
jgi:hypothetical protein